MALVRLGDGEYEMRSPKVTEVEPNETYSRHENDAWREGYEAAGLEGYIPFSLRDREDPDIAFRIADCEFRYYVLGERESIVSQANPKYELYGPGLIEVRYQAGGVHETEFYVNDPRPWAFLSRMMRDGLPDEILSRCDKPATVPAS